MLLRFLENKLRKLSCIFFATVILIALNINANALSIYDIDAETAVLMDAETGQILFDKGMKKRMHPASMTKIMTGLLTMEKTLIDEVVTVSEEAVEFDYAVSNIALVPGEELTVDSAMYALMLPSANDAANALAEHIAGTQAQFARLMTERAQGIGAVSTNFSNAHGLAEDMHYTTAYDMALITQEAIKNSEFMRYFGAQRETMPATNLQEEERPLTNLGYMLLPDSLAYYPEVTGQKVGYTVPSGHTMSTVAVRDGRTLICVVMKSGMDGKFYDTEKLLDYGFDSFANVNIPSTKLSGFTAPVMEENINVGEASFSAEALQVLAPVGITEADIKYEYKLPEFIEKGNDATAKVVLTIPRAREDSLPSLQMTIPLSASITYNTAEEMADAEKMNDSEEMSGLKFNLFFVIILPAGIIVFWIKRRIAIKNKRKRRLMAVESRRRAMGMRD